MLDYINYYSPTQQGFWTCFASEISHYEKGAGSCKIHPGLCNKLLIWDSLFYSALAVSSPADGLMDIDVVL